MPFTVFGGEPPVDAGLGGFALPELSQESFADCFIESFEKVHNLILNRSANLCGPAYDAVISPTTARLALLILLLTPGERAQSLVKGNPLGEAGDEVHAAVFFFLLQFRRCSGEGDVGDAVCHVVVIFEAHAAEGDDDIFVLDFGGIEEEFDEIEGGIHDFVFEESAADEGGEAEGDTHEVLTIELEDVVLVLGDTVLDEVLGFDGAAEAEVVGAYIHSYEGHDGLGSGVFAVAAFAVELFDEDDAFPASWTGLDGESEVAFDLSSPVIDVAGAEGHGLDASFAVLGGHVVAPLFEQVLLGVELDMPHSVEEGGVGEVVGVVVALHVVASEYDSPSPGEDVLADAAILDELEDGLHYVVLTTVGFIQEEDAFIVVDLELFAADAALLGVFDGVELFFDGEGGAVSDGEVGWRQIDGAAVNLVGESSEVGGFDLSAAEVDEADGYADGFVGFGVGDLDAFVGEFAY